MKRLIAFDLDGTLAESKQPIDQGTDRRKILIFHQSRVVIRSNQTAAFLKLLEQLSVVDVEEKTFGGGIQIGAVDEHHNALVGIDDAVQYGRHEMNPVSENRSVSTRS